MRWLILKLILFSLILLSAFVGYLASTAYGLQITVAIIQTVMPGKLQIDSLEGNLADFSVIHIEYHGSISFSSDHLHLAWSPIALLRKRIIIHKLSATSLAITLPNLQSSPSDESHVSLSILPRIIARHIQIDSFAISTNYLNSPLQLQGELNAYASIRDAHLTGRTAFTHIQGEWKNTPIQGEVSVTYQNDTLHINPSQLISKLGSIKLAGDLSDHWEGKWEVLAPSLQMISPSLKGSIAASGRIYGAAKNPELTGIATASGIKSSDISINQSKLRFSLAKDGSAKCDGTLNKIYIAGEAIPSITFSSRMTSLYDDIEANTTLTANSVTITSAGIRLRNILLRTNYHASLLTLSGTFQSGKGQGNIAGNVMMQSPYQAELHLKGQSLTLVDLKEYQFSGNPNVVLAISQGKPLLTGEVSLTDSEVKPAAFNAPDAVTDDLMDINAIKKTPSFLDQLALNTKITAINPIKVRSDTLNGSITGSLNIRKEPYRDYRATGQLILNPANYIAYGKTFTINNGLLIYTGNIVSNPNLDISAGKTIEQTISSNTNAFSTNTILQPTYLGMENVIVGIKISGTANQPIMTLFSKPAGMSQQDILSYILFGYPASSLKGDNQLALLTAAASLKFGNNAVGDLTESLQNTMGLNEVSIGTANIYNPETETSNQTTTLSLGKKLSDQLSIHYRVGLDAASSLLNIRYQLTKRLFLQTETSRLENGVDLLYGFERD